MPERTFSELADMARLTSAELDSRAWPKPKEGSAMPHSPGNGPGNHVSAADVEAFAAKRSRFDEMHRDRDGFGNGLPDGRGKSDLPRRDRFAIPANWTFHDGAVAAGFEQHVREQLPWYELATQAVAHVARHYIPAGGLVYDIGCSTGNIGRAIEPTLSARSANLVPIEVSSEMAALYAGPQIGNLLTADARSVDYEPFDLAVLFLTLMFVPVANRWSLLRKLRRACKPGGAIIVLDKAEAASGYAATVIWRLALAGKVASGVPADQIVAKELSLSGVQRPIKPSILEDDAVEFFRFGEFAGWLIEPA